MRVVNFGDLGRTAGWKTGRGFVVVIVVLDDYGGDCGLG